MGENKMKAIFYNDDTLDKLEQQEQWDKSLDYLNNLKTAQPSNKSILLRFAAQCWYVLTFWDCYMPTDKYNRKIFEAGLKESYIIAKEKWWADSDCLWIFGYFMCINQMAFSFVNADIREIEKEGNILICQAHFKDPNNQLAEILFLTDNDCKKKYLCAKKRRKNNINIYFPNESAVEQYFSEIFAGENNC